MDEVGRLFQIRRTVLQMLTDRGYIPAPGDMEMDREDFRQKYGDPPDRKQLTLLRRQKNDPTKQIFVFWPEDLKVGVKPIKSYCDTMKDEGVNRAILIVQQNLTPFAKQALVEMAPRFIIEYFQESELLVNITEHMLVPQHIVLTDAQKAALLAKYRLQETQLPRMLVTDPISKYFGLSKGHVVKIIRPSETAGRYVTYRLVVNGT
ncbi:DNA-directed RNA polymerases II and IV subunit 5A [Balamuthia mandrillaris]